MVLDVDAHHGSNTCGSMTVTDANGFHPRRTGAVLPILLGIRPDNGAKAWLQPQLATARYTDSA
jgi:hypothetical protein